jgi:hypothetical protein
MKGILFMSIFSFFLKGAKCSSPNHFSKNDLFFIDHGQVAKDSPSVVLDTVFQQVRFKVLDFSTIEPVMSPNFAQFYSIAQPLTFRITMVNASNDETIRLFIAEGVSHNSDSYRKGVSLVLKIGKTQTQIVYGITVNE